MKKKIKIKLPFSRLLGKEKETPQVQTEKSDWSVEIGNFQGIGKRSRQEDSFCLSDINNKTLVEERGILAVVADGMGGLENGAEVSACVTTTAFEYFNTMQLVTACNEDVECAYLRGMLGTIRSNVAKLQQDSDEEDSGSTLTAVMVREGKLYFLAVGDSHIYLHRGNRLYLLNREHNMRTRLIERVANGEMSLEEYNDMMGKSGLTNYIGAPEWGEIELSRRPLRLKPNDEILLLSDGVFGTLSDEEMLHCLRGTCSEAAKAMKEAIEAAGKRNQDNYTGVILRYRSE